MCHTLVSILALPFSDKSNGNGDNCQALIRTSDNSDKSHLGILSQDQMQVTFVTWFVCHLQTGGSVTQAQNSVTSRGDRCYITHINRPIHNNTEKHALVALHNMYIIH